MMLGSILHSVVKDTIFSWTVGLFLATIVYRLLLVCVGLTVAVN